jgi:hypothetical protein
MGVVELLCIAGKVPFAPHLMNEAPNSKEESQ